MAGTSWYTGIAFARTCTACQGPCQKLSGQLYMHQSFFQTCRRVKISAQVAAGDFLSDSPSHGMVPNVIREDTYASGIVHSAKKPALDVGEWLASCLAKDPSITCLAEANSNNTSEVLPMSGMDHVDESVLDSALSTTYSGEEIPPLDEGAYDATMPMTDVPSVEQFLMQSSSDENLKIDNVPLQNQNVTDVLLDPPSDTFPDQSDTLKDISKVLTETKKEITVFVTDIQDGIISSFGGAGDAVRNTYSNINNSILKAIKGAYNGAIDELGAKVNGANNTGPFDIGTPLSKTLKGAIVIIEGAATFVLDASGHVITEAYGTTKAILPSEAQALLSTTEEAAKATLEPLKAALYAVQDVVIDLERNFGLDPEDPIIPAVIVLGGTIYIGISFWNLKYGGYSGDLSPQQTADMLQKMGRVMLIDIRPQDLRDQQGIPDLRRSARFKFAAIDVPKVEKSVRNLLKNTAEVEVQLAASVIRNLKTIDQNTKVIIMDSDGTQSKRIARALRKIGIKSTYRIDGGFQSWSAFGLRSKPDGTEAPLQILQEEAEAIITDVKPTGIIAITLGVIAGSYALVEWEKTLQLIGVIGLFQAIYRRLNTYESAEDLKSDIRAALKPFKMASEGMLWIAGQLQPSKLELATSPSSSAVKARVLQAAAKHGSQPESPEPTQGHVLDESTEIDSNSSAEEQ